VNEEVENIGARRLHTILTTLLDPLLFDAPDSITESSVTITRQTVEDALSSIVRNRDLSRFIL
jgi:ATP-dependent HslUV protease ATP-binding subunit HslU